MGESKKRAAHGYKPPEGMERDGSAISTELSNKTQELIKEFCDKGMHPSVATQIVMLNALDVWRFNLGDARLKECFVKAMDQRLAFPVEYWYGATSN